MYDGFKVYQILVRHRWDLIQPSRFLMWNLNDHSPNAKRPWILQDQIQELLLYFMTSHNIFRLLKSLIILSFIYFSQLRDYSQTSRWSFQSFMRASSLSVYTVSRVFNWWGTTVMPSKKKMMHLLTICRAFNRWWVSVCCNTIMLRKLSKMFTFKNDPTSLNYLC